MAFSPLISVTMPNYNHGKFLAEAFESVQMQSYPHLEILVVDDGSTDGSRATIERFAAKDNRIKPVYFPSNQGAEAAHANCWSRVSGEVVYQYSSDDSVCSTDFFQLGVTAMNEYPQIAGFFGVNAMVSAETDGVLGVGARAATEGYIAPKEFLKQFLNSRCFVPGISSLWRKTQIDAVGGYDYRLGPMSDHFINHALPARCGVVFKRSVVAKSRVFQSRKSYSTDTTGPEFAHRLARFAHKLRAVTQDIGTELDADWATWRKAQATLLLRNYGAGIAQAMAVTAKPDTSLT